MARYRTLVLIRGWGLHPVPLEVDEREPVGEVIRRLVETYALPWPNLFAPLRLELHYAGRALQHNIPLARQVDLAAEEQLLVLAAVDDP